MKSAFCIQINSMSIFSRVKCAEMGFFAFNGDLSKIFPTQFSNSKNASALVAYHCFFQVLKICLGVYVSQIFYSIVRFLTINVVNAFRRKLTCEIKPCKSMGIIFFPVYAQNNISSIVFASSNGTSRASACSFFPGKYTSLRIVGKKLVESRLCKHVAPHQSERHPESCSKRWMKPPVLRRVSCQSILQ